MADAASDWTVGYFEDPYNQLFPFPDATETDREVDAPARTTSVICPSASS